MSDTSHDDEARQWWEEQHETFVPHVVPSEYMRRRRASSPESENEAPLKKWKHHKLSLLG